MSDQISALKQRWLTAKSDAAKAVEKERQLREELFYLVFNETPEILQKNKKFGLRGKIPVYRTIDEAVYEASLANLRNKGIPDHLVRYKPSLNTRVLKSLPHHQLALLSDCITERHGLISLELI